jgi:hypothetical protein
MRFWVTTALLFVSLNAAWAQAPASPGCDKNISFAIAENGQPAPAVPKFVSKWLGGNSRKQGFPGLCFSQAPSNNLNNYLVVFSTSAKVFEGLKPTAHTYKSATPGADGAAPVNSYGGTWTYAYAGVSAPNTTDTLDLKRDDKPKAVDARAYDQTGRTIAQGDLNAFSSRDKLLEKIFGDIMKDSPSPESRKALFSPLYYVNCDVEGQPVSPQLVAMAGDPPAKSAPAVTPVAAPKPGAPPPPQPEFAIWSTPAGADIFLDGQFVGKTPMSVPVSAGEHTIDLRKKNFAIWQRKMQAMPGQRRVGGSLEQKVLNLE